MKLGIVGTGMIVQEFLPLLTQLNLDDVALFGRNPTKTAQLAQQHGIRHSYTDYHALLQSEVDTLYIALPNHLHSPFAEQALAAGKHVILEKPITANARQFRQLRQLAKQQNKILIEAVTIHYLPAYCELKNHLARLGQIKIVSLNYSQYSSRYDRFKAGETPPVFDPQQAGGALMDLNVYNLHFAIGLFGKPQNCYYAANLTRHIDTSGVLLLNFHHFQAVCIGAKDCQAPVMLTIQGDNGNITISAPANQMQHFSVNLNNGETAHYTFDTPHRMLPEFQQFIRIIDEQDHSTTEQMLDISAAVMDILDQARRQQGIFVQD
ncbi:NAD(P)-dependent oxidoreductase [[Actinobacillus] muris]|uniref:NAD(P)-dependent oxidoreductase n=1 Tax=Muribacter muris TaxID=67855 RepID=A0A0J5P760_9PAST|nr:Gfo/Idh/MocA family oxidoreductase [Muribacter muris]KMK51294.1 NAD(P)-dependent oxidoreductase [[Actinobacillus] muris] [Muribacter muris]